MSQPCISYFSAARIKYYDQNQLREKGFVLEEYSPSCRKALHGNRNRKLADSTTSLFIYMKCVCGGVAGSDVRL